MGLADSKSIGKIIIHPTGPDTVYVAALGHLRGPNSERGVCMTTDGGKMWTRVLFLDDATGVVDLAVDSRDPNTLYAAAGLPRRVRGASGASSVPPPMAAGAGGTGPS
jgi:hypothetical protein